MAVSVSLPVAAVSPPPDAVLIQPTKEDAAVHPPAGVLVLGLDLAGEDTDPRQPADDELLHRAARGPSDAFFFLSLLAAATGSSQRAATGSSQRAVR